ncbi:hypothetical protein [Myxacorys almedinensis]|uniref:Uncharacterized protein n=1 Tax=Myxacorys almedinensis A TaxID=2690445 RepID=A0A8J8CK20_9CYAN|nr:hypothetical protein [Myxacorys almedinensis]NDJ18156.1 hypothetical protein [Myxacorys almedinensis A]
MSQNDANRSRSSRNLPRKSRSSVPQPLASEQTPSFVRTVGIHALRRVIQGLETLVETLETQPNEQSATPTKAPRSPRLPKRKLNNRALAGILAGVVLIGVLCTSMLFPAKPPEEETMRTVQNSEKTALPQPAQVAPSLPGVPPELLVPPPPIASPEPTASFPTDRSALDSTEVLVASEPDGAIQDRAASPALSPDADAPESMGVAPDQSTTEPSEPPPEPMPNLVPEPAAVALEPAPQPKPPVELTPEQSLIASIDGQMMEISDRYASALVQRVQPNFRRSRLRVGVSDRWYQLSPAQQNQLGDELLARSQDFDFTTLELTDANGALIARSPVVGSSLIILKRLPTPKTG